VQRIAVIDRRERYRQRLEEQEEKRAQGESVWTLHDNAAFKQATNPQLSVVVTMYNYAHHIEECIVSIAAAGARLAHSPELVIVNDASTDGSLAQALSCQAVSELPIRIVDKKLNTGLADARNVGTQIARAPYVFMMDADNLIFPEALRQLLEAITENNSAAAYSLLCRFRGNPRNRVGLLSQFDWDPQILAQYPYIDAMALFRREALLACGGYDNQLSQIGWFGWEDYDLWLRFAQRNYQVAYVPNTLCLYRHHDMSMINTTNLFEAELVKHFIQRYGDLLERFEKRETVFGVKRARINEVDPVLASSIDGE
jgi:glycosyltransferase involved in cell wall biosynthesis